MRQNSKTRNMAVTGSRPDHSFCYWTCFRCSRYRAASHALTGISDGNALRTTLWTDRGHHYTNPVQYPDRNAGTLPDASGDDR